MNPSWLITGGSGFLGNALVSELLKRELSERICIYSRCEHRQAEMREKFNNDGRLRWFIGDVRDKERLRWAMSGVEYVVAAAALKRIETGAYAPSEMVATNVIGAMNVIDAAAYCGVKRVVGISSDKAWNPISPYGQTKALAESLMLTGSVEREGPSYGICRYGNVFGSTGSIVPKWRSLIANGATELPVTNPSCTRFFMKIEEAADLVIKTMFSDDRLSIPELPAFTIGDLAEAFGLPMKITGLPKWEKLHEGMADGITSDIARRMSVDELREALNESLPNS